jgi:hypothetical protein
MFSYFRQTRVVGNCNINNIIFLKHHFRLAAMLVDRQRRQDSKINTVYNKYDWGTYSTLRCRPAWLAAQVHIAPASSTKAVLSTCL